MNFTASTLADCQWKVVNGYKTDKRILSVVAASSVYPFPHPLVSA